MSETRYKCTYEDEPARTFEELVRRHQHANGVSQESAQASIRHDIRRGEYHVILGTVTFRAPVYWADSTE